MFTFSIVEEDGLFLSKEVVDAAQCLSLRWSDYRQPIAVMNLSLTRASSRDSSLLK